MREAVFPCNVAALLDGQDQMSLDALDCQRGVAEAGAQRELYVVTLGVGVAP